MRFSSVLSLSVVLSIAGLATASPIPSASFAVVTDDADLTSPDALDFEVLDYGIDRDALQNIFSSSSHGATEDILDRMLAIAEARASSLDDEDVNYLPLFTTAIAESIPSPARITTFFASMLERAYAPFSSPLEADEPSKAFKAKAGKRRARRVGSRHP
jgi:hypothetical protein